MSSPSPRPVGRSGCADARTFAVTSNRCSHAPAYDEVTNLVVYETDVAGTIVAEMTIAVRLLDSGQTRMMRYVGVARSAGGRIVSYRDYLAPARQRPGQPDRGVMSGARVLSQVRPGRLGRESPKGARSAGAEVRTASRHGSDVDFDWHDRSTWPAALDGCDRAYLVPPAGLDVAPSMVPFIELARGNGVERLALLSNSVFRWAARVSAPCTRPSRRAGPTTSWCCGPHGSCRT